MSLSHVNIRADARETRRGDETIDVESDVFAPSLVPQRRQRLVKIT